MLTATTIAALLAKKVVLRTVHAAKQPEAEAVLPSVHLLRGCLRGRIRRLHARGLQRLAISSSALEPWL
eukprot:SAG31_NODE_558_length_14153_cov_9.068094_13_plen_69_part_00